LWELTLDALMLVSDDRRLLRVNAAAEKLLGAPAHAVVGQLIDRFVPPEHHGALRDLWIQLVETGAQEGHFEVLRADGSTWPVEYRALARFTPGQHLIVARPLGTRAVHGRGPFEAHAPAQLTPRERSVLALVAEGLSAQEIAERLFVSAGTVRTHLKNAYSKLGAHDRGSAVAGALRRGLLD
jgi:PAS domain S-box-containing protein